MTTQVIIKSPSPNHQDVSVATVNPQVGETTGTQRLREGEEVSLYLHSGQRLQISEVEKAPVAEVPAADVPVVETHVPGACSDPVPLPDAEAPTQAPE